MTETPDPVDTFQLLQARADDPPNVRALRWAVIGMGVILIGGFLAVIGRIAVIAMRPAPELPVSGVTTSSSPQAVIADFGVNLPVGAKVRTHAISGSQLSVLYDAPSGDGIIILDLTTGRQLSHVHLAHDPR